MQTTPPFREALLTNLSLSRKPQILDLGAGDGSFALELVERGCEVIAVEKQNKAPDKHPGLQWSQQTIEEAISKMKEDPTIHFHGIVLKNSLQFLKPTWVEKNLIPFCQQHLHHSGLVAIRTFFAPPVPALRGVQRCYTDLELRRLFGSTFTTQHVHVKEEEKPGQDNVIRTWSMVSWIARYTP